MLRIAAAMVRAPLWSGTMAAMERPAGRGPGAGRSVIASFPGMQEPETAGGRRDDASAERQRRSLHALRRVAAGARRPGSIHSAVRQFNRSCEICYNPAASPADETTG